MIGGILSGLRTLFWAMILLLFVIFVLGLLTRSTLGEWCSVHLGRAPHRFCDQPHLLKFGSKLFSTLPRACFTAFRCLTEGCSSYDGTPLLVHIYDMSWVGTGIVFVYVVAYLAVTFGLFNLILGVFVESTMESAKHDERKRRRLQGQEHLRVAKKLHRLVVRFCNKGGSAPRRSSIVEPELMLSGVKARFLQFVTHAKQEPQEPEVLPIVDMDMAITREMFRQVVSAPEAQELLDELDVNVMDHLSLFDALDADGSGSLDVQELLQGILQLRGTAEKTDAVASVLKLRNLQQSLRVFQVEVIKGINELKTRLHRLETTQFGHRLHRLETTQFGHRYEVVQSPDESPKMTPESESPLPKIGNGSHFTTSQRLGVTRST